MSIVSFVLLFHFEHGKTIGSMETRKDKAILHPKKAFRDEKEEEREIEWEKENDEEKDEKKERASYIVCLIYAL